MTKASATGLDNRRGIFGGYSGEGSKTIVPASAGCKLTCRLVPDQDPQAVQDALVRHLERHCPPGVELEVTRGAIAPAIYSDPEKYFELYELAEKLVDIEDAFQNWRFKHMYTVQRIIGNRQGTGGSSGVPFLKKAIETSFFPELFSIRSEL